MRTSVGAHGMKKTVHVLQVEVIYHACSKHMNHISGNVHGDDWTTSYAAQMDLNCLQYAHEHGCPWGLRTTAYASLGNRIHCLHYALKQGFSWDIYAAAYAAQCGHLECLQYLHEHGYGNGKEYNIFAQYIKKNVDRPQTECYKRIFLKRLIL